MPNFSLFFLSVQPPAAAIGQPKFVGSKPMSSKSSITITRINANANSNLNPKPNPIKQCSVMLQKLDESTLSQSSNLSVVDSDKSMVSEGDNEQTDESTVKRKITARCKSQQQMRNSREAAAVTGKATVAGNSPRQSRTTAARRCSSLNTTTGQEHSDTEPPKKVARASAAAPPSSAKKSSLKVVTARNTPSRSSPRNKK